MKPQRPTTRPFQQTPVDDDAPLPLEVERDDEADARDVGESWRDAAARQVPGSHGANGAASHDPAGETSVERAISGVDDDDVPAAGNDASHMSDILRWALDSMHSPAMAAADWLARDIDPQQPTAVGLLTNPGITLAQARQAKSVFKTMRIVGEKSADRRVGARMYAAAIAAGLVRHGRLVSRQSDAALRRGFQALLDDQRMPATLRDLGGMALCALADSRFTREDGDSSKRTPGRERGNGHSASAKRNGRAGRGAA